MWTNSIIINNAIKFCNLYSFFFPSYFFDLLYCTVQFKRNFGRDLPKSQSTVPCAPDLFKLPKLWGCYPPIDLLYLKYKLYKIQGREYRNFIFPQNTSVAKAPNTFFLLSVHCLCQYDCLVYKTEWFTCGYLIAQRYLIPKSTDGAVERQVMKLLDLEFPVNTIPQCTHGKWWERHCILVTYL